MKIIIAGCGKVGELLTSYISREGHDVVVIDTDAEIIEDICGIFSRELVLSGFSEKEHKNAEEAAYDVNSGIFDADIRNMSIFA